MPCRRDCEKSAHARVAICPNAGRSIAGAQLRAHRADHVLCAVVAGHLWKRRFPFILTARLGAALGGILSITEREETMAWTTPTLVEICIGLEINGYLPAEF